MAIQAVILAGGEGSRLRPLTKNRPKVLLPVANTPILGHLLDSVVEAGIRDITVVVGYRKEQVLRYLSDYTIPVDTVVQKKQLGPYDAIKTAFPKIHAEKILILPGDNYIDSESIRLLLKERNAILVSPSSIPEEYGLIIQEDNILTGMVNNPVNAPKDSVVSCGVYLLEKKNLELLLEHNGFENIHDLQNLNISVIEAEDWQDAVNPVCLLKQNSHLLSKLKTKLNGNIDSTAIIRGHVVIGEGTVIGPNTVITGPCCIGDSTTIGPNVCIDPETSIGSRVTVEPFTYMSNSIIMGGVSIGTHSRIVDTVIGEGTVIDTVATASRNGIGTIIGDRACVGSFTRLKNTIIGNNAVVDGAILLENETIPDDARVI